MPSPYGQIPEYDEAWGDGFFIALTDYMDRLYLSLETPPEHEVETLSGEPFDGCETCDLRERYLMAVKLTIEGYTAGRVRLVDAE